LHNVAIVVQVLPPGLAAVVDTLLRWIWRRWSLWMLLSFVNGASNLCFEGNGCSCGGKTHLSPRVTSASPVVCLPARIASAQTCDLWEESLAPSKRWLARSSISASGRPTYISTHIWRRHTRL